MFDIKGQRKYLTRAERKAFIEASEQASADVRTFCLTLAYTGARISEVRALTPSAIDSGAELIVIESLKKRRKGVFRAVPVPKHLLDLLEDTHGICEARRSVLRARQRLWPWSRTTAWSKVKDVMAAAGIPSSVSMPKALRHGFGVAGTQAGVPLNLVQKWLGHARLETTAIYTGAVGHEEMLLAERLWSSIG